MESLLDIAARHAVAVLDRCADRWSGRDTPLLADHVDLATGEPERWEGRVMTNLARQQHFLRLLDALERLGAGPVGARDGWLGAALPKLADPGGLLYWGGHSTYDLGADAPLVGNHELKCVYPHYEALYRVDPGGTTRFLDAFWQQHVWDWETLLFNRHGDYGQSGQGQDAGEPPWEDTAFAPGPLPIVENTALSFINTGSDLIFAAAERSRLTRHPGPLAWARHLLSRYDQIRHPETGLGAYQFNHREPCRVRESFDPPLGERADVNEATVVTAGTITTRYQRAALTFLHIAEVLGPEAGRPFLDFVLADLRALARYSWDADAGCFHALLNDGTRLGPQDARERGYCPPSKLRAVAASGGALLTWVRAWRLTGEAQLLEMARAVAGAMGWSRPGALLPLPADDGGRGGVEGLFALLEAHAASGEAALLDGAEALALRLVEPHRHDGLLARRPDAAGAAAMDNVLALGLARCAAARGGSGAALPAYLPGGNPWDPKILVRTVLGRR